MCSFAAAVGLWDLVPVFSIQRGHPYILLSALKSRSDMCRGAIACLLKQRCLVPLLLEQNGQWLFEHIVEKCNELDTNILKVIFFYFLIRMDCKTLFKNKYLKFTVFKFMAKSITRAVTSVDAGFGSRNNINIRE